MREHFRTVRVAAVLATSMIAAMPAQRAPEDKDDSAVYSAVVRHARPRYFPKRGTDSRPLSVVDTTVPTCENGVGRDVGCVTMTEVERVWAGVSGGNVPAEQTLPAATRARLMSQFRARNVESRPVTAGHANLTILSSKEFEQERDRTLRGEQVSYIAFSLPAYADRYAVVHAMYVCGNLCAYGWMFLLEQSESGWRVLREHVLWVS